MIQAQLSKSKNDQQKDNGDNGVIVGINHCRSDIRLHLMKKEVQDQIAKETGTNIEMKGVYIAPGQESSDQKERPLYLYITGDSSQKVEDARSKIIQIMEKTQLTTSAYTYKVFTGIDNPEPQFRINGKIIGPQGAYIKHIVTTTKAKVHLKGKGSNFIEAGEKKESDEPLHLFISAHTEEQLNAAKKLAENLMETVRVKYDEWKKEQQKKLEETKKQEAEKEEAKKLQQQMMNYQMYMYPQMMGVQGYPMMGMQQTTTTDGTTQQTTEDQNNAATMMNQMSTMDPEQYKQYMQYYYNYYYSAYGYPNMMTDQTTNATTTTTTEENNKEEKSNEESSTSKRKREEESEDEGKSTKKQKEND